MGKDLKGKELGVGISQLPNKKYIGRFTRKNGKRIKREFDKLQECRKWLADTQFDDEHGNILKSKYPTVDAWYEYWISEIKGKTVKISTIVAYKFRYQENIKHHIGKMLLEDVKPLHCQNILNSMTDQYEFATIKLTRAVLSGMFETAFENELIQKNPVTKNVKCIQSSGRKMERRVLSVAEQRVLSAAWDGTEYANQFSFLLQTGIRIGELSGLRWSDIDFEKKTMTISRTAKYMDKEYGWVIGTPKTKSGLRTIPLTAEAIKILTAQKEKVRNIKVVRMEYADHVFISEKGMPIMQAYYNLALASLSEKCKIERVTPHTLRHTFATRCIEGGMNPKTLQIILGHHNIAITMDLYVHVTEETKVRELESIEKYLAI